MMDNLNISIQTLPSIKIIGQKCLMSFAENQTKALWQSFMPLKPSIRNAMADELYSVEIYPGLSFFNEFNPHNTFEKWAGLIVTDFDDVPDGMETLVIPKGEYAVFIYRGKAGDAPNFYRFIFGEWMPSSPYTLDDRPHFAVMGDKYKNDDDHSEEEIWIPVAQK